MREAPARKAVSDRRGETIRNAVKQPAEAFVWRAASLRVWTNVGYAKHTGNRGHGCFK